MQPAVPAPVPEIHNMVSTTQIRATRVGPGGRLEPHHICMRRTRGCVPCTAYDRRRFAAITLKLAGPNCTALLFTSGKLVITGNRTWHQSLYAAMQITRILRRVTPGVHFSTSACAIQNIVARVDMELGDARALDLAAMYRDNDVYCNYTRSVFPGLVYRPADASVVLLCFQSGRVVVTGGKCVATVYAEWERLYPRVCAYVVPLGGRAA
jgi:transcription initiation factor TFIID TATA-box-binding protein